MMKPKLSRCLVVGVNGFKGGAGNSLLSNVLAVWGSALGLKVAHVVAHEDCHNPFHEIFPDNVGLFFADGEDGLTSLVWANLDLVFIDLPRDAFTGYPSNGYKTLENMLAEKLDVLISPTDISSTIHLDPLIRAYQSMDERGLSFVKRIVAFSKHIYIRDIPEGLAMLEPWLEQLHDEPISFPGSGDAIKRETVFGYPHLVIDDDMSNSLWLLMNPLIESITGDSLESNSPLLGDKKHLQIAELVELLDPA